MKKERMNVYVPGDVAQRVRDMAIKLGITQSGVVTLAVAAGLDALTMASDPNWKAYFEAMIRKNEDDISKSGR